jgi:hypothetical protein
MKKAIIGSLPLGARFQFDDRNASVWTLLDRAGRGRMVEWLPGDSTPAWPQPVDIMPAGGEAQELAVWVVEDAKSNGTPPDWMRKWVFDEMRERLALPDGDEARIGPDETLQEMMTVSAKAGGRASAFSRIHKILKGLAVTDGSSANVRDAETLAHRVRLAATDALGLWNFSSPAVWLTEEGRAFGRVSDEQIEVVLRGALADVVARQGMEHVEAPPATRKNGWRVVYEAGNDPAVYITAPDGRLVRLGSASGIGVDDTLDEFARSFNGIKDATFANEQELITWLDTLYEMEGGMAIANRKWEPAQAAIQALHTRHAPPDNWHKAVLDACMVIGCGYVGTDPHKTLQNVINWHAELAKENTVGVMALVQVRDSITELITGIKSYTGIPTGTETGRVSGGERGIPGELVLRGDGTGQALEEMPPFGSPGHTLSTSYTALDIDRDALTNKIVNVILDGYSTRGDAVPCSYVRPRVEKAIGDFMAFEEPALGTDLSKRLRAISPSAAGNLHRLIQQAADEIDRYYSGMMAWKKTAEAKDTE